MSKCIVIENKSRNKEELRKKGYTEFKVWQGIGLRSLEKFPSLNVKQSI